MNVVGVQAHPAILLLKPRKRVGETDVPCVLIISEGRAKPLATVLNEGIVVTDWREVLYENVVL